MELSISTAIMLCAAVSATTTYAPSNKDLTGLFRLVVFGAECTDLSKLVESAYINVSSTGSNMVAAWNKKLSKCGRD